MKFAKVFFYWRRASVGYLSCQTQFSEILIKTYSMCLLIGTSVPFLLPFLLPFRHFRTDFASVLTLPFRFCFRFSASVLSLLPLPLPPPLPQLLPFPLLTNTRSNTPFEIFRIIRNPARDEASYFAFRMRFCRNAKVFFLFKIY